MEFKNTFKKIEIFKKKRLRFPDCLRYIRQVSDKQTKNGCFVCRKQWNIAYING